MLTNHNKSLKIAIIIIITVVALSLVTLLLTSLYINGYFDNAIGKLNGSSLQAADQKQQLYRDISQDTLLKEDGTSLKLSELNGKPAVLVYWASWCPFCMVELSNIDTIKQRVEAQGGVLYLINKLDGKKETKENALSFLKSRSIKTASLFDDDVKFFNRLGLATLPTTLVVDVNGRISNYAKGSVPEENKLQAMILEAQNGKASSLQDFIKNEMLTSQGGIRTNYLHDNTATPSGDDVLSESQGLMMLAAVQNNDSALFDKLWQYVKDHSTGGGLPAWVTTKDGSAELNATIDDLRIYRALCTAEDKWGGYKSDIEALGSSLLQYDTDGKALLDCYDFSTNQASGRFTLCYADFEALNLLQKSNSQWQTIYQRAMEIVQGGVISKEFPLYQSWYDYTTSAYHSETLNMSEALVTLLHLSRVHKLPPEALQWLRDRLDEGAIYARYGTDGRPTLDGRFESSAVYAICTLIAISENDSGMAASAIALLEKLRIYDAKSKFNGIFGNDNGSGVYSFDQCTALLAYLEMEKFGK